MRATWIADDGQLRALAPRWARLCDRAAGCAPFARPEWLLPWLGVFGGGSLLRVLTIEDGGELAALIPFVEVPGADGAELALMGGDISDHHDAPAAGDRGAVGAAIARALSEGPWARVTFDRLREDGWLRELARQVSAGQSRLHEEGEDPPCPTLVAGPDARALDDLLPEGFAYRLGRARRKAERAGGLALRRAASPDEALFLFDALSAFHAARWQARGEPGVLGQPDVQRFHRRVIPGLQQAGVLRMFALELAGALAGVVYAFSTQGRLSFYLSGFDLARESASPGVLAVAGAIEHELAAGVRVFDFLRGREAYKYRFGARDAACYTARVARGAAVPAGAHDQSGAGASSSSRV
jgi:CelD/BcsL family acetyltransferase involved in cellulose biosynthesis